MTSILGLAHLRLVDNNMRGDPGVAGSGARWIAHGTTCSAPAASEPQQHSSLVSQSQPYQWWSSGSDGALHISDAFAIIILLLMHR